MLEELTARQESRARQEPGALEELAAHLEGSQGVLTRAAAKGLGVTPAQLRVLTRQHRLVHVGRGAYVDAAKLATQTPEGQHALRARAIAATLPDTVALSHHSAACLLDLPLVGTPPVRVHAARRAGGEHRRTTHYTIHTAYPRARSHKVEGVWLIEPAVVVLGVAALHGLTQAVVTGDAALHAKLLGREDLKAVLDSCRYHPGVPTLRAALPQLDPACESPGESKARMLLKLLGYAVRSQVTIADEFGDWVARVDFLLEGHKVVIEFDGMTKYVDLDGSADPKALRREKAREDRLRAQGYEVVRLVWSDLASPERVRSLVEAAIRRADRG